MAVVAAAGVDHVDLAVTPAFGGWEADAVEVFAIVAHGFTAFFAETPDETLGEEGADGGGDEEWFHAHVDETGDPRDSVVGVEGGENEVAGERGADGDFGGFQVAHFPDHDDVRIGAENRAQAGGEGQVDFRFDGDLHHAFKLVFDRVLDGDDAAEWGIEFAEEGVEAG